MARFTFPRSFYLPKNPTAVIKSKRSDAVVYLFEEAGRPLAKGFIGKQSKPALHTVYRSVESRARDVASFLANADASAVAKAERDAKRRAFRHTLTVGSILRTSWGYDQTNIEYFQVTKLIGETMVEVREIAQESTETGYMQGKCVPVPGRFLDNKKPRRHRVLEGNTLDIHGGFGYASLEEPTTVGGVTVYRTSHWTSYA